MKATRSIRSLVLPALTLLSTLAHTAPPAPAEPNLLRNPSFEAVEPHGAPAAWSVSFDKPPPATRTPRTVLASLPGGQHGERQARLTVPDAVGWALVQQLVPRSLQPGEEYAFSLSLKGDKAARVELYLAAVPALKGRPHCAIRQRLSVSAAWARHEVRLRVDDDTKYVKLRCLVQAYDPGLPLAMDDARCRQTHATGARTVTSAVTGCVRTDAAPTIDGELNDPCWQNAGRASGFLCLPDQHDRNRRRAVEQTTALLAYDQEHLHLAFQCLESDMTALHQEIAERDGPVHEDDCVEIFLAPPRSAVLSAYPGFGEYFHLIVNSRGVQRDGIGFHAVWNAEWRAATATSGTAWTAEMSIPFAALGAFPENGDFWKVNFCRHETRLAEFSSWSPLEERFHEPQHFGTIGFVSALDSARLLEEHAAQRAGEEIRNAHLAQAEAVLDRARSAAETLAGLTPQDETLRRVRLELDSLVRETGQTVGSLRAAPRESLLQQQEPLQAEDKRRQRRCAQLCNRAWVLACSARDGGRGATRGAYAVFEVKPVSDTRTLPSTNVHGRAPAAALSVAACPGEYEPASFVVVGSRDLEDFIVTPGPLRNGAQALPAAAIDLKLVKCWHQAADRDLWEVGYLNPKGSVLLPELLLNDDALIRVDIAAKTNAVRVSDLQGQGAAYVDLTGPNEAFERVHFGRISDAPALQPVRIPAGACQQFWVTVRPPDDAQPGEYAGTLALRAANAPETELPLRVRVHPFRLARSVVEQVVFCVARMGREEMLRNGYIREHGPAFNHYWSRRHMRLALRNLRRHGIDAPMFPQTLFGERSLSTRQVRSFFAEYMQMLVDAGYPRERFYCQPPNVADTIFPGLKVPFVNYWRADPKAAEARFKWGPGLRPRATVYLNYANEILDCVRELKAKADAHGFGEFWFYFADEIMDHEQRAVFPLLQLYRQAGVKCFFSTSTTYFIDAKGRLTNPALWDAAMRSVDGVTFAQKLKPELAAKAGPAGVRLYSYNNPQMGVEHPHTYRRNYGLALWKAGYAGAMNYCYTDGRWNEFASAGLRGHCMVYPSADRMIDTLQWEGYREGVDDLRYLSTLLQATDRAKAHPARRQEALDAEQWLRSLPVFDTLGWDGFREGVDDPDLDELRAQIADRIVRLSRD